MAEQRNVCQAEEFKQRLIRNTTELNIRNNCKNNNVQKWTEIRSQRIIKVSKRNTHILILCSHSMNGDYDNENQFTFTSKLTKKGHQLVL